MSERLPRQLHPGAWWLWALGMATAASRTTNPLNLLVIAGAAGCVVAFRRTDAVWARGFGVYLKIGLVILVIRVVFRALFDAQHGTTILFTLPEIDLPDEAAGIRLGGPVSAQGVLSALYDGIRLATLLLCLGAANVLANPKRLLKALPGALHELGVAVTVALTIAPQLVESAHRVRRAQRLRPTDPQCQHKRRRASYVLTLVGVLEDALDRSLVLASAMDSRGYGRSATVARSSRLVTGALMLGGVCGLCVGVYGVLDGTTPPVLGVPMLVAGCLFGVAGVRTGGRRVQRSVYRPSPWTFAEWSVVACGVAAAVLLFVAEHVDPGNLFPTVQPLRWPALGVLPALAGACGVLPAWLAPPVAAAERPHVARDVAVGLVIEFDGVTVTYEGSSRPALRDVTLSIPEGELCLVVGHTGAGKSTLLGTINGLVPHFTGGTLQGSVRVAGLDTRTHAPRQLAGVVGVVVQDPVRGFVADTVEDELAYGMEQLAVPAAVMRKRVEETLDLMRLADLRHRPLDTLSGGQQQRVAIGSVLTSHPKVLVLDEPTSALDPAAAEDVLAALTRLVHDLGLTVVLAEHRLERVVEFADMVVSIDAEGRITSGDPAEMMRHTAVAPPVVRLGQLAGWNPVPLSVRDARRRAGQLKQQIGSPPERPSAAPTEPPALEARNVVVRYGSTVAVAGVDLELHAGTITALMGRNGSGKSSLLWALTDGAAAHVALLPQSPADLLYLASVEAECELADRQSGQPAGTCRVMLDRIVPGVDAASHPRDLSEGQRLALALAVQLCPHPDVVLLDEPTRGLDEFGKRRLAQVIGELAAEGRSIVVATHDVEFVAGVAQRVVVMAGGEIVADGPTADVVVASPVFAPQVAKVMAPERWLTVDEVATALALDHQALDHRGGGR